MSRVSILMRLLDEKVVAIIRLKSNQYVQEVLKHIAAGGLSSLEITSNTPKFDMELVKARKALPEALIGAGTIYTAELARIAIESGAQYLVTPSLNVEVIDLAHKHDIPVLMGCMTPTEIAVAVENGADIIKLFPAGNLGIDYFKAIKAPFSDTPFFAVGSIKTNDMPSWVQAGASGFGVGSSLFSSELNSLEACKAITANTSTLVEMIYKIKKDCPKEQSS